MVLRLATRAAARELAVEQLAELGVVPQPGQAVRERRMAQALL